MRKCFVGILGIAVGLLSATRGLAATACVPWIAEAVSIQCRVEAKRRTQTQWIRVHLNDTYCGGDSIRAGTHSRAGLLLRNQTVLRLDQGATIVLPEIEENKPAWLELIRGVARPLAVDQTIEPTQVAGFNQFFDDTFGSEVESYGIGLNARLARNLYGGVEYSQRDLKVPLIIGLRKEIRLVNRSEDNYRVYIYWTPHHQWEISTAVEFEQFNRASTESSVNLGEALPEVKTFTAPLSARYFHPSGIFAKIGGTFVRQSVDLEPASTSTKDSDDFVLLDAAIGYRS